MWLRSRKKGKNQQQWAIRTKIIFLGDWTCKCVSYYKY